MPSAWVTGRPKGVRYTIRPAGGAMEIRKASKTDTDAVLELWRAGEASTTATDTPEHLRTAIDHPAATVLVAVSQGQIVGSLIGTFDGWRGHMYRLVVHPSVRRQGIGKSLVRGIEEAFQRWDVRRVIALVERDRPAASQFWQAIGYSVDEFAVRHVRTFEGDASR